MAIILSKAGWLEHSPLSSIMATFNLDRHTASERGEIDTWLASVTRQHAGAACALDFLDGNSYCLIFRELSFKLTRQSCRSRKSRPRIHLSCMSATHMGCFMVKDPILS